MYTYKSIYSKNAIYNCERGACIVSTNKRKREDNNKNICVYARIYTNYEIYNCERGATTIHPRRR